MRICYSKNNLIDDFSLLKEKNIDIYSAFYYLDSFNYLIFYLQITLRQRNSNL